MTLVLSVGAALLIGAAGLGIGIRTVLPGPSSTHALDANAGERWARDAGLPKRDTLLVFLSHPALTVDDERFEAAKSSLRSFLQEYRGAESNVPAFTAVQGAGSGWLDDDKFISEDRHSTLLKADSVAPIDTVPRELRTFPAAVDRWIDSHPGFDVAYLANSLADNEIFELIDRDLDHSLRYTLPLTLAVLLWSFGSIVAAVVPIGIALLSLSASLGTGAVLSHLIEPVSATAAQLVVLLVLAVGVDYSLFIISRVREGVARGLSHAKAIDEAGESASVAVFWSGMTVSVSLAGLFLMGDSVLSSMALVSTLAVIITMFFSLVTLPALLRILGDRIDRGKISRTLGGAEGWKGSGLLRAGTKRPALALALGLSMMAAISLSVFQLRLGSTIEPVKMPPGMQSAHAFAVQQRAFPELAGADFAIILKSAELDSLEEDGALDPFLDSVAELPTVTGPIAIDRSNDRTVARYRYVAKGSVNDEANRDLIETVRSKLIPDRLAPIGVHAGLSGTLPFVVDDEIRYTRRTPVVLAAVIGVSFIFLLLAFRSIVVPLKAALLNCLSTAAAFGLLVVVFQHSGIEGWSYGVVESFVPPLLFCILFGLSMDYHVFLLSRVREEIEAGADTRTAVMTGISSTGRTITSAAFIMISVFAIIASLELPVMRQLGLGLAAAVLLDATVVRLLLLPASLILLGRWNWYLPKLLRRLPELRI